MITALRTLRTALDHGLNLTRLARAVHVLHGQVQALTQLAREEEARADRAEEALARVHVADPGRTRLEVELAATKAECARLRLEVSGRHVVRYPGRPQPQPLGGEMACTCGVGGAGGGGE